MMSLVRPVVWPPRPHSVDMIDERGNGQWLYWLTCSHIREIPVCRGVAPVTTAAKINEHGFRFPVIVAVGPVHGS